MRVSRVFVVAPLVTCAVAYSVADAGFSSHRDQNSLTAANHGTASGSPYIQRTGRNGIARQVSNHAYGDKKGGAAGGGTTAPADGTVSNPVGGQDPEWGEILFVNGYRTEYDAAKHSAGLIAKQLDGLGVRLVWNDLTDPILDVFAVALEKVGDDRTSVNAATRSVVERVKWNVAQDRVTWVVGYSAGSICVNNAMNALARDWGDEAAANLAKVRVLTVGCAVLHEDHLLAAGWPNSLKVMRVFDREDQVSNTFGPGWLLDQSDPETHSLDRYYLHWITTDRFDQSGYLELRDGIISRESID